MTAQSVAFTRWVRVWVKWFQVVDCPWN
jgi:hypothetical protein